MFTEPVQGQGFYFITNNIIIIGGFFPQNKILRDQNNSLKKYPVPGFVNSCIVPNSP